MNDIARHKQQEQTQMVSVRLPSRIREQAKKLAAAASTANVKVFEVDIYRQAIEFFIASEVNKLLTQKDTE